MKRTVTGMKLKSLTVFFLTGLLLAQWALTQTTGALPASPPGDLTVVSAASYAPNRALASETITAAFGANLSTQTAVANSSPLPTELAGVFLKVRDSPGVERRAPLFFVSPGQINFLMPGGTASGTATLTVVAPAELGEAGDQVFLLLFGTGLRAHSGLPVVSSRIGGSAAQAAALPR